VVAFSSDHFGRCIAWTATSCFQCLTWRVCIAQTKVNDLDVVLIVKKQILWLEIAVADSTFVNVLYARDDLLKKLAGFLLLESFSLNYVLKQFTSRGVFHYQEKLTACLYDLKK